MFRAEGRCLVVLLFALSCGPCAPPPLVHVNVLTQHNDNQRTGRNLQETILTPTALRSGNFGKLFSRRVVGQPYTQPLYVHDLDLGGGKVHNVVFSATQENHVYAFDADHPLAIDPLWDTTLGPPWRIDTGCADLLPVVGITSTPVIDLTTNTMYVVAKTDGGGPRCPYVIHHNISHQLHALDLRTGQDKMPPTTICGAVPGHDEKNEIYDVYFDSRRAHQRPALLLDNGTLYVAFGSHCDQDPYWGWAFAFDAKTLKPAAVPFLTTPFGDDGRGSLWQAGGGLAADGQGNVYGMTGNGQVDLTHSPPSVSNSFIKLRADTGVVSLQSYYTVPNHAFLNYKDWDLGSSGPLLMQVQDKMFLTGGGKDGMLYLVDAATMQSPQAFQATPNDPGHNHIHGSPVYFDAPGGRLVYVCPEIEKLHAYRFDTNSARYDSQHPIYSDVLCSPKMPGGFMSVSANGTANGIVWLNHPINSQGDDNGDGAAGGLTALDANSLSTLWDSSSQEADALGAYAKFTNPTIADGKVFVHAFDPWADGPPDAGWIHVFGMRCTPGCKTGECVNGTCQACTPDEIHARCDGRCDVPDGCGGTCRCGGGKICTLDTGDDALRLSPAQRHDASYFAKPPGGGGGGGTCVCSPETIKRNCAGKCDVSNGCGGVCSCETGSCDPATNTCCDWQSACQTAGPCHTVCNNVTCPCASGTCTADKTCCSPSCSGARCGQNDGCGGSCFGTCPTDQLCVDDGSARECQPRIGLCKKDPRFCDVTPAELITSCSAHARNCWINLTHGHGATHSMMPAMPHPVPKPTTR